MDLARWVATQDRVSDAMRVHTRPFATALFIDTPTVAKYEGSATFVSLYDERIILTCEHCTRVQPLAFTLSGKPKKAFPHPGPWVANGHPVDMAFADMTHTLWKSVQHKAASIPYSRFAKAHRLAVPEEILFFRGYAGENANYGFGTWEAKATGYCSQQVKRSLDGQGFDIFWDPAMATITSGTSPHAKKTMKFDNAKGFSGSLVWNTRYLEVTNAGGRWRPEDAVVTGLVRRWDTANKAIICYRVERMRAWLDKKLRS
jgi:hypothetical protein